MDLPKLFAYPPILGVGDLWRSEHQTGNSRTDQGPVL